MKLLIFHPALAPYRIDFFNALAAHFETELVLFDRNLVNQKFDQAKLVGQMRCAVSYLMRGFRWKDRYFRFGTIWTLLRVCPRIVLVSEYGFVPIVMAFCKVLSFNRFRLYTITDDNLKMFQERGALKRVLRWLFVRLYDGIVVTNDEVADAYRGLTPKGRRIVYPVVPILHDTQRMRGCAAEVFESGRVWRREQAARFEKLLLFVGRLDPEKNVGWLIERMREMPEGVGLVFVGSGSQEAALKEKVQSLGLSNIIFAGRMEGQDVYAMMSMADAMVLPSLYEPYGAVVGEALQWGTPCLVSEEVGAKSLIKDGINGAVFSIKEVHRFGEKVRGVLSRRKGNESLLTEDLGVAVAALTDVMEGA